MDTPRLVSRRVSPALLALLGALLAPPLRSAEDPAPKDHSIFVGLDVDVGLKGKYYRVIGAEKNAVRIMLDHKETVVPLVMARDIHFKRGVKLTNLNATIANLHGVKGRDRAQAAANAESRRNSMAMQSMIEDQIDSAASNVGYVTSISDPGADGTAANIGAEATAQTLAPLAEAANSLTQLAKRDSDMQPDESGATGDLSATGFVVSFDASAPVPLPECHVAIVASYTIPGGSGQVFNKVSLRPLGLLEPIARKISCELQGFPAGAEMKGYRLAFYSGGLEIATNISARRMEVTRDEAVIFLTMDYLAKHPGETLPPAPVLMVPRSDFVARLGSAPLDQVIYAKIGKDGKVLHLSTDAAGWTRLIPELDSVVAQIAFVPALEKGKPVEGLAKFKLADLVATN